jgi:hypothetical protein
VADTRYGRGPSNEQASGSVGQRLIARDAGVDFARPGFYAAGDGLRCVESLLAQPVGDAERTRAVMAQDEQAVVGVQFLVRARRYVAHRHQQAVFYMRGFVFPRLADIYQLDFAFFEEDLCVLDGDFIIVHVYRILLSRCQVLSYPILDTKAYQGAPGIQIQAETI